MTCVGLFMLMSCPLVLGQDRVRTDEMRLARGSEDLVLNLNLVDNFHIPLPPPKIRLPAPQMRPTQNEMKPQYTIRKKDNWSPGSAINICFFDDDNEKNMQIERGFREWEKYVSLQFNLHKGAGGEKKFASCTGNGKQFDIRVGYGCNSNWSVYGRQSYDWPLLAKLKETNNCVLDYQTMNIGAVNEPQLDDVARQAIVLHEIGHALGFMHEHQRIDAGCSGEINELKVKAALVNQGYTLDQFVLNYELFELESSAYLFSSNADRASIMNVYIDPAFLHKGTSSPCFIPAQTRLSELDKVGAAMFFRDNSDGAKVK